MDDLRLDGEDLVVVAEELLADGVAGGLVADVVAAGPGADDSKVAVLVGDPAVLTLRLPDFGADTPDWHWPMLVWALEATAAACGT